MDVLMQLLAFGVTVLILVSLHEAGHYVAAKLLGIKVVRFSVGLGKALARFRDKAGTEYVLALIPLGGYVKLLDGRERGVTKSEQHLAFNRQPLWARVVVILAGPVANIIVAMLGCWLMFIIGVKVYRPIIQTVQPHSIAAMSGLKAGDEIVKVDGRLTPSLQNVAMAVIARLGEKTCMAIETINPITHQSNTHLLRLTNWQVNGLRPDVFTSLGIAPLQPKVLSKRVVLVRKYRPLTALRVAGQENWQFLALNVVILKKLIVGEVSLRSLGGPLSIFQVADAALKQGVAVFLGFLALISMMLAFINLLPIPGLDGGYLLNCLIELVIRRPLSLKYEILSIQIGMLMLMAAMLFATFNDILRLFFP